MRNDNGNIIDFAAARQARRPIPTPCPARLSGARAHIYRPARSVLQRGRAARPWLLEFEPTAAPWIEPLMGWCATRAPLSHVRLSFQSREQAVRFAERHGWPYSVAPEPSERRSRARSGAGFNGDEVALQA